MKKKIFTLLTLLLCICSGANATITAKWDWKNNIPSGIQSIATIQYNTGSVASDQTGVSMYVDATSGKLAANGDNAQFNSGTILQIPVVSTSDVVTFTPHSSGYAGVTIGEDDYDDTTGEQRTHTATAAEVKQGYVQITSKGGYLYSVTVELAYMPTKLTAKWDWQNGTPSSITETNISGTNASGTVASDIDGTKLSVLAAVEGTDIKLVYNSSGYTQFNTNTAIRVPVSKEGDVVTVISFPGQYNYTVGGTAATANTTVYTATAVDVTTGYVEIVATSTAYLYSIFLTKPNDNITIGSTGWATYSNNSNAVDFTNLNGVVEAYTISGASGTAITKADVDATAKAGTGLLLNAAAGTYVIPLTTSGTDYSASNKLVAVSSSTTVEKAESGYTNYVLALVDEKAVFQYINGTSATVGAGKAYLKLNISDPASARTLTLDDETTGINEELRMKNEESVFFDLQGRRVAQPIKGLYIVNGKKVIIK